MTTNPIIKPRATEKAGMQAENANVYTFEVAPNSTKGQIKHSVTTLYKVIPTKIRIINHPSKNVFVRGKNGSVPGFKKALVYLKEGDKIAFI